MRGLVLALLITAPALAGFQSLSDDMRLPEFEGARAVARVTVLQDSPWPTLEISLYAAPASLGEDPLDGALAAIQTRTNGAPLVARSAYCPGLRTSLESLRNLPPVPTSPRGLAISSTGPLQIPPTKKDGARYEIKIEVISPDRQDVLVTIDDYAGDYSHWGDALVQNLAPCWTRWN